MELDFTSRVVADVYRMSGHVGPIADINAAVTQALSVLGITRTEDRAVFDEDQLGLITDVFRGILGAGAEQIERITKAFTLAVMPGSMVVVDQDSDAEAMASAMASNKKRKLPLGDQGDQGDQGFLPSSLVGASASAIQRAKRSVGRKTPRVDALTCAFDTRPARTTGHIAKREKLQPGCPHGAL